MYHSNQKFYSVLNQIPTFYVCIIQPFIKGIQYQSLIPGKKYFIIRYTIPAVKAFSFPPKAYKKGIENNFLFDAPDMRVFTMAVLIVLNYIYSVFSVCSILLQRGKLHPDLQ